MQKKRKRQDKRLSKDYVKYFGYTLENRYNPNIDPIYVNAKEFTNDKSLRR